MLGSVKCFFFFACPAGCSNLRKLPSPALSTCRCRNCNVSSTSRQPTICRTPQFVFRAYKPVPEKFVCSQPHSRHLVYVTHSTGSSQQHATSISLARYSTAGFHQHAIRTTSLKTTAPCRAAIKQWLDRKHWLGAGVVVGWRMVYKRYEDEGMELRAASPSQQ